MDVRLSPEQAALRDSVTTVVERLAPHAVGALAAAERASKLEAAVVASGWRELRTADDSGAPVASAVEVALVAEQLGRGLADTAFIGPTLAAELRRLVGAPPATRAETVAFTSDLARVARFGKSVPETTDAVVARTDLVAVDAAGATAALARRSVVDGDHVVSLALDPTTEVDTVDGGVDLTRTIAPIGGAAGAEPVADATRPLGEDDWQRWMALGLALTSADLVGVMTGALHLARDYAADRHQYGVAVGSFQAVQHLLADALVSTEGSRSATLHAAWAVDALPPADALAAGAVAKAYSSRAARLVCETAIQVHGGIGNTWECLAHVYLRRALVDSDLLGGAGPNLARVLSHRGVLTSTSAVEVTDGVR